MTESRKQRAAALDGKPVAEQLKREAAEEVNRLQQEYGAQPCLAVVRIGEDAASEVYVRNKVRTSESVGIKSEHHALPIETSSEELLRLVDTLNKRDDVDGILVQLPLPPGIDERTVLEQIDPAKDVDGFHPVNVGRLSLGQPTLAPCTPAGIIELLQRSHIPIAGANACVVGRSHIVGRPMAQLLLRHDATVTICHSKTKNLPEITSQADILVAAIGRAGFIRAEHVKPGATVIDVGMNKVIDEAQVRELFGGEEEATAARLEALEQRGSTLVGDVHPAEVRNVAGRLTPVPGGVGLLTVAMLMKNTVTAANKRRKAKRK